MKNILLNGKWELEIPKIGKFPIDIPSAVQSVSELGERFPSDAMQNGYLGDAVLKKEFISENKNKHISLTIGGLCPYGEVYLNNTFIGEIPFAQVSFSFDVTNAVILGKNLLEIKISEKNTELLGGLRFDVLNWSGIYGDVFLEVSEGTKAEDIYICPSESLNSVSVSFFANGETDGVSYCAEISGGQKLYAEVSGKLAKENVFSLSLENPVLWELDNPHLYTFSLMFIKNKNIIYAKKIKFGMRVLKAHKGRIYLNNSPIFLSGAGEEYFSPEISPIKNKELIRKRFLALKEFGFDFVRYHTHNPTKEEFEIADEVGLLLSSEIPVLSNFNRIKDTKKGFMILEKFIKQTRNHPSSAFYCLGNEGAQLLVREDGAEKIAHDGLKIIKDNTKNQLALVCFGFQNEISGIDTDVVSPHLWSTDFRWAYNGLTSVPWDYLTKNENGTPMVIHEFGKYGVWPDSREDDYLIPNGYRLSAKEDNKITLGKYGEKALEIEKLLVKNSRALTALCIKTAAETMRRNSLISGYLYWTFFRMGLRSGGICSDTGTLFDFSPSILKNGANAHVSLVTNKDFGDRVYFGGEFMNLGITVSNYGKKHINNAVLKIFGDGISQREDDVSVGLGENKEIVFQDFSAPITTEPKTLKITAILTENDAVISQNSFDFYIYPKKRLKLTPPPVYNFENSYISCQIQRMTQGSVHIWDYISVTLGCVIPEYNFDPTDDKIAFYIDGALIKNTPALYITDKYDDTAMKMLESGVSVLILDDGKLKENCYPKAFPKNTFFDLNRFYTPFRTGWDEGNAATVIKKDSIFYETEKCEFADLRFFGMTENSLPLNTEEFYKYAEISDYEDYFCVIQRLKQNSGSSETVYFEKMNSRIAKKYSYFSIGEKTGAKLCVTSLNFFRDQAGEFWFGEIIKHLTK